MGVVATYPLRFGGFPITSKRGKKSEVAHKWAQCLHNPSHLGGSPMGECLPGARPARYF